MGKIRVDKLNNNFYQKKTRIKTKIIRLSKPGESRTVDLDWTDKEFTAVAKRVLGLRYDQLVAFMSLVGVEFGPPGEEKKNVWVERFARNDRREDVAEEIKKNKLESAYLPIVIYEAGSKENLLWWLEFFEKANKKKIGKK